MDEVERVARAMWARRRETSRAVLGVDIPPWEDETPGLRDDVLSEARAAIAAMQCGEVQKALDHVLINIGEEGFIPRTEAIRAYGHLRSAPPQETPE